MTDQRRDQRVRAWESPKPPERTPDPLPVERARLLLQSRRDRLESLLRTTLDTPAADTTLPKVLAAVLVAAVREQTAELVLAMEEAQERDRFAVAYIDDGREPR